MYAFFGTTTSVGFAPDFVTRSAVHASAKQRSSCYRRRRRTPALRLRDVRRLGLRRHPPHVRAAGGRELRRGPRVGGPERRRVVLHPRRVRARRGRRGPVRPARKPERERGHERRGRGHAAARRVPVRPRGRRQSASGEEREPARDGRGWRNAAARRERGRAHGDRADVGGFGEGERGGG